MFNLIDSIIELDKNARQKSESAQKQAEEIRESAAAQSEELEKEYKARISACLAEVERQSSIFSSEELGEIKNKEASEKESLIEIMDKNKSAWEKDILARITDNRYGL
ncbi:MAG: hypothetical protein LBR74_07390 [Eubacterium sp.]|jgi:bisphosphoglycerate-dependent phosphoglycerate mutase|nr:hypothetical protein [Eubacterium sp.]